MRVTLSKKRNDDWVVERTGEPELGPYRSATLSLQVASIELAYVRRLGPTSLCVKDEHGVSHICKLIEAGPGNCLLCENQWFNKAHSVPPRCPLWEAIRRTEGVRK